MNGLVIFSRNPLAVEHMYTVVCLMLEAENGL